MKLYFAVHAAQPRLRKQIRGNSETHASETALQLTLTLTSGAREVRYLALPPLPKPPDPFPIHKHNPATANTLRVGRKRLATTDYRPPSPLGTCSCSCA